MWKCRLSWFPALFLALSLMTMPASAAGNGGINRFNVSVVVDASGSMKWTDPSQLRFGAIRLFLRMLTEQGNVVGGVVFSTGIDAEIQPEPVNAQADKDRIAAQLEAVPANGSWTNLGEALMTAAESLLRYGNPSNPSVVLFLSDGNTDMSTDREKQDSLDRQAEAIRLARENGIQIYSICLNAGGTADTDEMRRISGGEARFQDISRADDLREAFNRFYDMIYGTSTQILFDDTIPSSGLLETDFEVPGVGVEEVNIIIYGDNLRDLSIFRPDGTPCPVHPDSQDSVTTLKITDLMKGTWHLRARGVPEDQVKVNMKYNTDMVIDVQLPAPRDGGAYKAEEEQSYKVAVSSNGVPGNIEGYSAEMIVTTPRGDIVVTNPMKPSGNQFETTMKLPAGSYDFTFHISGFGIEQDSRKGPLVFEEADQPENHAPEPVQETLTDTVYVLPTGSVYRLDLNSLAADPDGDPLSYAVSDSSFLEGTDFTVDADGVLTMRKFPLSGGVFHIAAMDPGGLSCTIEVSLRVYFVAWLVFLGILAAGAVVLIFFLLWLWHCLGVAFMGSITVANIEGRRHTLEPGRGRVSLRAFEPGDTGLGGRCYFQATARSYIWFVSPWPGRRVYGPASDRPVRRVRIDSGPDALIYSDAQKSRGIDVYFQSTRGDEL